MMNEPSQLTTSAAFESQGGFARFFEDGYEKITDSSVVVEGVRAMV